jgi:hypothetical protein
LAPNLQHYPIFLKVFFAFFYRKTQKRKKRKKRKKTQKNANILSKTDPADFNDGSELPLPGPNVIKLFLSANYGFS